MIKNLNETLSLISLIALTFMAFKVGIGWMFSMHRNDTFRGNLVLRKNYSENEEE